MPATMTPTQYLQSLPAERRAEIAAVRAVILQHLPAGFEETVQSGMLAYVVPLSRKPDTYNGQPLQLAALAAQKRHGAVYLMPLYADEAARVRFEKDAQARGKKLDVGKSCVRFEKLDDLPLDLVGQVIARHSVDEYCALIDAALSKSRGARAKTKAKTKTKATAAKARRPQAAKRRRSR